MNTPRLILAAVACMVAYIPLRSQSSPLKADAINNLKSDAETDSVQFIERMAAYLFHEKLNDYRSAKQLNVLMWDDSLWLASRNHSVWMSKNDKLGHDESSGTPGFTGKSPGDRYAFATSSTGKAQWCGENALYNYSADPGTAMEVAERIAQYSLEQWQTSPGHNENMLAAHAYIEGTAFIIDGEQVWATSLFARKPINTAYQLVSFAQPGTNKFNATAIVPSSHNTNNTVVASRPVKAQSTYQMEKSIRTSLTDGMYANVETEKALGEAAKNHVSYMSLHKTKGSMEQKGKSRFTGKTPQKRVRKTSHGFEFIKRIRTRVFELTFSKTYPAATFTPETAAADATSEFNKQRNASGDVKKVGLAVKVKKQKDDYTVYIVALERRLKNEEDKGTEDIDF